MTSIFQRHLGTDFGRLHPALRERFGFASDDGVACVGTGVMASVWRGPAFTLPFLHLGAARHILFPESEFKDFKYPEPFIPDSPGQQAEWVRAIKEGKTTASPFSYAGLLTEANHLGTVAYRAGTKIAWDTAQGSKLTPAAPGWAAVEGSGLLEEFFQKIAEGGDVTQLAAEYDEKIGALLNG